MKLAEFFDNPLSRPYRVEVFDRFVRDFETKLNQLKLVEMGVKVAKEFDSALGSLFYGTSLTLTLQTLWDI